MNLNAADGVLVHELIHLLISLSIASFFWWRYRDLRLFFVVLVIGIFIDIDHWFDYLAWFGLRINLKNFFNVASYVHQSGKVYIPLHGWEWLAIFWLVGKWLGRKLKIKGLEWAVALGYLGHLLWDNFCFTHHPWAYSLIFRFSHNFSLQSFDGF